MKKKITKLEKQVKKHEKLVEQIIADKTKALVRAKRGEYWIKDHQEAYQEVVRDYNEVCYVIKKLIKVKNFPFWMHIVANLSVFLSNPIKFIFIRPKMKSRFAEEYWGLKKIKKEWEDDFDYTEKVIDEDFKFVEECEAFIEKQKELLNRGYKVISKQQREQNKND